MALPNGSILRATPPAVAPRGATITNPATINHMPSQITTGDYSVSSTTGPEVPDGRRGPLGLVFWIHPTTDDKRITDAMWSWVVSLPALGGPEHR
jgi:hypothetical protein